MSPIPLTMKPLIIRSNIIIILMIIIITIINDNNNNKHELIDLGFLEKDLVQGQKIFVL